MPDDNPELDLIFKATLLACGMRGVLTILKAPSWLVEFGSLVTLFVGYKHAGSIYRANATVLRAVIELVVDGDANRPHGLRMR